MMSLEQMKRLVGDIRFWLALAVVLRLWGITDPPLENSHSWRQAFTNMVARNMAEGPFDLLHPRTDLAGERPDVVASEFPAFNAIIAVIYRTFGPAHWYGRLVALLISTLGTWCYHRFLLKRHGTRVAFLATFVLLWSSWFIYGRKSMPDTFSVALALIALFFVDQAIDRRSATWLLFAVAVAALGGLCKIPAIVLLVPWGLLVLDRSVDRRWRMLLVVALLAAVGPVLWWYFHWQPHLLNTYGNPLYFPNRLAEGWSGLMSYPGKLVERFTYSAMMSHVAFAAMIVGIYLTVLHRERRLALCALVIVIPFGYFMIKAGSVFPLHAYYILPLVPLMTTFAGIGLARVPVGIWTTVTLVLVVAESLGTRWSDLSGGAERSYLLRAEALANDFTGNEDLVATNAGLDPRMMYYLHRHGWSLDQAALHPAALDSLREHGLKAVFIDRHVSDDVLTWQLRYEDDDLRVYVPPQR